MPADASDLAHATDPELTPGQRLQSLAELLVIGLQRLRKRPQIPPESPNSAPSETLRIPHE
jgi:hypothetical protein